MTHEGHSPQKRYGAILWTELAAFDEAIQKVQQFDDLSDAVGYVEPSCEPGECWAVVDLTDGNIIAGGIGSDYPTS